jgi:hypothetical protein
MDTEVKELYVVFLQRKPHITVLLGQRGWETVLNGRHAFNSQDFVQDLLHDFLRSAFC